MSKNQKSSVVTHVKDDYKFTHTRTTKTTFTDSNNQRHSVINKDVRTATQSRSYNSKPQQLSITQGSSGGGYNKSISGPRDRATYTHTAKTTYKGPNKESVTFHDRNFHSSIQRQTYNPSSRDMVSYGSNYYYDSD